jgi:hypothetical protein
LLQVIEENNLSLRWLCIDEDGEVFLTDGDFRRMFKGESFTAQSDRSRCTFEVKGEKFGFVWKASFFKQDHLQEKETVSISL